MREPRQNDININLWLAFMCEGGGGGGNGVEIGSVYEGSLCPKILSSRGMAPMTVSLYCENPRTRFSRPFESEDSSKNVGQWPYGPSCCL